MLSGLADLQIKNFRFANSANIAGVVTSVWTDLIITAGYFLHIKCAYLPFLIMNLMFGSSAVVKQLCWTEELFHVSCSDDYQSPLGM